MKTHRNYVSLRYYDYILFLYHIIKTTCFFFRTKKADFKGGNMLSWLLVLIETPACALTHCHLNPREQWSGQFVLFVYTDVQNQIVECFSQKRKMIFFGVASMICLFRQNFCMCKKEKKVQFSHYQILQRLFTFYMSRLVGSLFQVNGKQN